MAPIKYAASAERAEGEAFPFEGKVDLRVVRPEKTDEVREITAF